MHLKMNEVRRISLSYSVSISQYNVLCFQQISRVVFILSTTQVYHESRLFSLIFFPASFMVVKMNQLIMLVPKDLPCIYFIDKYFLKDRTMDEINPHTTVPHIMTEGWAWSINPSLWQPRTMKNDFRKEKKKMSIRLEKEEGKVHLKWRIKQKKDWMLSLFCELSLQLLNYCT